MAAADAARGAGAAGVEQDHAARVRCPAAAGLHPGAGTPVARGAGTGPFRPQPHPRHAPRPQASL